MELRKGYNYLFWSRRSTSISHLGVPSPTLTESLIPHSILLHCFASRSILWNFATSSRGILLFDPPLICHLSFSSDSKYSNHPPPLTSTYSSAAVFKCLVTSTNLFISLLIFMLYLCTSSSGSNFSWVLFRQYCSSIKISKSSANNLPDIQMWYIWIDTNIVLFLVSQGHWKHLRRFQILLREKFLQLESTPIRSLASNPCARRSVIFQMIMNPFSCPSHSIFKSVVYTEVAVRF